jgi:hypothetical protein
LRKPSSSVGRIVVRHAGEGHHPAVPLDRLDDAGPRLVGGPVDQEERQPVLLEVLDRLIDPRGVAPEGVDHRLLGLREAGRRQPLGSLRATPAGVDHQIGGERLDLGESVGVVMAGLNGHPLHS